MLGFRENSVGHTLLKVPILLNRDGLLKKVYSFLLIPFLLFSGKGQAFEYNGCDATFFGGFVRGKSQKFILDDFVVTQIDWPIEALFVLGGTLNFNFCCNRLHFTAEGWGKVASKSVKMIEQDFLSTLPELLTNFSLSPNTIQRSAYLVFVEGSYDFLQRSPFKLAAILGYQHSQFSWQARGGSQINIVPAGSLIVFPDVTIVSYKQQFSVPYFGLALKWEKLRYFATIFGKYSPFAYAKDVDHHTFFPYAGLTFIDTFRNKNYWIVGTDITLCLYSCFDLDFKYIYEAFEKSRNQKAQIEHYHHTFEIGLKMRF